MCEGFVDMINGTGDVLPDDLKKSSESSANFLSGRVGK
jgi:hypothetical protein